MAGHRRGNAKKQTTEIVPLANVVDAAREFMAQSKAENTKIAYASDWKHFEA